MRYTLVYAATCLSDYWGGHHLPHISVPVSRDMTAGELRDALRGEVNQGAIAGADAPADNDAAAHAAMLDAISVLRILCERPFAALEDDDDEDVFAFFIFVPAA